MPDLTTEQVKETSFRQLAALLHYLPERYPEIYQRIVEQKENSNNAAS